MDYLLSIFQLDLSCVTNKLLLDAHPDILNLCYVTPKHGFFNKELGYTIDAVNLVVGMVQLAGGVSIATSAFKTASMIGKVAGSYVAISGGSSAAESFFKLRGDKDAPNYLKETYVEAAKFMGFDNKSGLTAYHSMEIISSAYGVFRLGLKPSARRLYRFIPADFRMQVNQMSRASLTLEILVSGNNLRVISGMNFNN